MKQFFFLSLLVTLAFGCGSANNKEFTEEEIEQELAKYSSRGAIYTQKGIKLTELLDFPPFEDVSLSLLSKNVNFKPGKNKLEFDVLKFNLGEKTAEESLLGIKTIEGGQRLLLSEINSAEHNAVFSNNAEREFKEGENFLLCLLQRSNRITLKGKEAKKLYKITILDNGSSIEESKEKVLKILSPFPKENAVVESKILLDFIVFNEAISEKGSFLLVQIDDLQFKIFNDSPYVIEGLEAGKHEIKVSLMSKEGKLIESNLPTVDQISFEVTEETGF